MLENKGNTNVSSHAEELARNPFKMLGLALSASRDEIANAHDDALADGKIEEADLREARRQLLAPKLRLAAELSLFPDANAEDREAIMKGLRENAPLSDLLTITKSLPPYSQALALSYVAKLRPSSGVMRAYALARSKVNSSDICDMLALEHAKAGIPQPSLSSVTEQLDDEFALSAKRLFVSYRGWLEAASDLRNCLEDALPKASPALMQSLTALTEYYSSAVATDSQRSRRQIEDSADLLIQNPSSTSALSGLKQALLRWDEFAQPLQVLSLHKGRDEPSSRELFEFLRGISLDLANEKNAAAVALEISSVCATVFAELPRASSQLQEDIEALQNLADQAGTEELVRFAEGLRLDLDPLVDDLIKTGFDQNSVGIAQKLYEYFETARSITESNSAADLPWMIVRGLAIDINNDLGERAASAALLNGLQSHRAYNTASPSVRSCIESDLDTLRSNAVQARLSKAVNDKDHSAARTALAELTEITDDASQKASYQSAIATIDARPRNRIIKFAVWGVIIIGGIALANSNNGNHSTSSSRTYVPSSSNSVRTPSQTVSDALKLETAPPVGTGRTLNRDNIRYCLYQNERLEAIQSALEFERNSGVIEAFNNAIDDYNSRCASFKYYHKDLSAVQSEIAAKRGSLSLEGAAILQKWRAAN